MGSDTIFYTDPQIPDNIKSKLFDIFFTTKEPGERTSIDLGICYKIVNEHGGTLEFQNLLGGVDFVIKLPLH